MPADKTQKALVLTDQFGDFEVATIPIPQPLADEVIVKVEAAGLNPVDWKIQKHGFQLDKYPAVLGTDLAGEVVELGPGVTTVAIGDKVFLQGTYTQADGAGGFQQYARADVHTLAKIPSNITVAEAATIPVAFTAAYIGLYNVLPHGVGYENPLTPTGKGKYSEEPIVILGGSTSVGQYAIQLAKLSGFSPIIVTASPKHTEYLQGLGATHVLNRSQSHDDIVKTVKELIGSKPLDVVFDTASLDDTQKLGLDLLAPNGKLALVLHKTVEPSDGKQVAEILAIKQAPENVELARDLYSKLTGLVGDGSIKPNRVEILPGGLNGIVEGFERQKQDKVSGSKLVVLPQETPFVASKN